MAGGVTHRGHGGHFVVHLMLAFDNLLQPQAAQGENLPLHVGVLLQHVGLGKVVVVILGDDVAGAPEVGSGHATGVTQVPTDVVGMQMSVDHKVHLVGRGGVGVGRQVGGQHDGP